MNAYQKAQEKVKCYQACHRQPCCCQMSISTPGPTGPAPSFQIGSVTTGAPGTNASVTLTPIIFSKDSQMRGERK